MTERKRDEKKSEWIGSADSAAYDAPTEQELQGLNVLGGASIRDGAIDGVSDPVLDGGAAPHQRPDPAAGRGPRKSPDLIPDAGMGDGGLSASGGVAGGAAPGAARQEQGEHDSDARRAD